MTGLYLTAEAVQARRLELATVEEQIRALGRRKSVLRAEILSGYAAPVKGAPVELLDAAGAIVLGSRSGVRAPWGKAAPFATPSATVGDEEIAHDLQALTRRYVRGLVEDWGGDPTTADLAGNLELPAALIDSVLIELRAAQELLCDREGRWSVRSPRTSAAARTAPLFADVEPAPAGDGLEPEGDES